MEAETTFLDEARSYRIKTVRHALAEAIKHRRAQLTLSQQELASKSGLCRSYVSDVERGTRSISFVHLVSIAHALQMPPWRLVQFAEQQGLS